MMRWPMGSFSLPSSARYKPAVMCVFGTMSVSTTLIHGVHFIELKYCAAALISSSVMVLAKPAMRLVLAFRGSALLRMPFLKSSSVCMM